MKKATSACSLSTGSILSASAVNAAKKAAGYAAAKLIPSGSCIGLGTGSTVAFFLEALSLRCRKGLQITAVCTSKETEQRAKEHQIPLIEMHEVTFLDITVDGADEIDIEKQMIKGGGGALLREKILASLSKEMIVIVDSNKCVTRLGLGYPLPVEVVPFGAEAIVARLSQIGYVGKWRLCSDESMFITDNGNYIFDVDIAQCKDSPRQVDKELKSIVGVIETGFFFDLAGRVIVGFNDGHVEVRE